MSWLEPFFVAGEVMFIRNQFGDYTTEPHIEECRTRIRFAAARIGIPAKGCLLTAASVLAHLERAKAVLGPPVMSRFERKFMTGWEWREMEGLIDVWIRYEYPDVLKPREWIALKDVLIAYDPKAFHEHIREQSAASGKAGADARWRKEA